MTTDWESNEMLYDKAVPNFGEKEKLRILLQRIDSGSQQLTIKIGWIVAKSLRVAETAALQAYAYRGWW